MKIKIRNITKRFGSVLANNDIDIEISSKKIHALLGENGAGKSTLVKIISGHYNPDSGEIFINDKKLELGSTSSSLKNGIGILSQDPLDFQNLSIKESFIAGSKKFGENFNEKKIEVEINKAFKKYEIELSLNQKIRSLSIGERQQIELIRLLFENSKIIILDPVYIKAEMNEFEAWLNNEIRYCISGEESGDCKGSIANGIDGHNITGLFICM